MGQKYFAKKDVPLLTKYTSHEVPYRSDSIVRRLVRISLRTFLFPKTRNNLFLPLEVWANKCRVGDVIPQKAVYLVGIGTKIAPK